MVESKHPLERALEEKLSHENRHKNQLKDRLMKDVIFTSRLSYLSGLGLFLSGVALSPLLNKLNLSKESIETYTNTLMYSGQDLFKLGFICIATIPLFFIGYKKRLKEKLEGKIIKDLDLIVELVQASPETINMLDERYGTDLSYMRSYFDSKIQEYTLKTGNKPDYYINFLCQVRDNLFTKRKI